MKTKVVKIFKETTGGIARFFGVLTDGRTVELHADQYHRLDKILSEKKHK